MVLMPVHNLDPCRQCWILIEVVCYVIWFSTDTSSSKISVCRWHILLLCRGVKVWSRSQMRYERMLLQANHANDVRSAAFLLNLYRIGKSYRVNSWNDKRAFYLHINGICYISTQITIHTYDKIYPNKINVLKERDSHDANLWCVI